MQVSGIIVCILFIIVLIESVPYIITILFPDFCYGNTSIGKIHQYINQHLHLAELSWISYLLIFLYFIYLAIHLNTSNYVLKYGLVFICLFLIYLPTNPILTVVNLLLEIPYRNPPFIQNYHEMFPTSVQIEQNSNNIINEFETYSKNNDKPECLRNSNPGFKIEVNSVDDKCWRVLFLKKRGNIDKRMVKFFPVTTELLKDEQIHNAFFSILDPGIEIVPHTGYYKGYLRYHLGVEIPNNDTGRTDDKAYIVCGGQKHIWEKHKGVVFDDMYLHYVKNPSNQRRVVLYLDIKRNNDSKLVNMLDNFGIYLIENSLILNTFIQNQHKQTKL